MDGMLILWIFLLVLGLALLVKGADFFVDGAADIARRAGVSPLVIGLTVVAFGTSAPELAVSVTSAISHSTDIAVGNVVGSNLSNILLILGLSALVRPLPVQRNSFVLDLPVLCIASLLLIGLGIWGGALQWWDGLILIAVFAGYLILLFRRAKKDAPPKEPPTPVYSGPPRLTDKLWFVIFLTVIGLSMVVGGGTLLVEGAKYIAAYLGMPQRIIGLTVVAIGTSLPELVTSVVASAKGETDIAVGNILGSNIFNIFLVAGAASLFYPLTFTLGGNLIDALVSFAAVLLLTLCALLGKNKLRRWAGAVMLASFFCYYVYLFLAL